MRSAEEVTMRLARIAVGWSGALLVLFGALYVVAAERMLALAELTSLSPTALTDARVMYGALEIAPGLIMLASLGRRDWLEPAVVLAMTVFAFVAGVRVFGVLREGAANQYHLTALCIEIPTSAFAWVAWRGLLRERPND